MSTVGVVPGINRLREFPLPVTLAVSLHAPDDALREELVPLNRRYPIAEVLDAARAYAAAKGRRVTFEYACIAGTNDHPHQADALADHLRGFPGRRPRQPHPAEPHQRVRRPRSRLATASRASRRGCAERGVQASIRRNRGVDIDAACGQLRARTAARELARAERARGIGHNGPVNEHRFFNPSQPQTLQTAVLLCYLSAVFGLIFGVVASSAILALFIIIGLAAGGYGIANEKRWGYLLAVTAASLHVLMYLLIYRSHIVTDVGLLISFVFDVALVLLLVHPMSRDYQRIWFK